MTKELVTWNEAYNHILVGGKARHESWHPNCFIMLNKVGELSFQDGTDCWLEPHELMDKSWIILPSCEVWEIFEDSPELGKILTKHIVTKKMWEEKNELHRKLYNFYEERGSLSIMKGGWCITYRECCGFIIDLSTTFNPLTIYSSNYQDVKEAMGKFMTNLENIVELEKMLFLIKTDMLDSQQLKEIFISFN